MATNDAVRNPRRQRNLRIAAITAAALALAGVAALAIAQPWKGTEPGQPGLPSASVSGSESATPTSSPIAASPSASPTASAHVIGTVTANPNLPPAKPLMSGLLASAGDGWSLVYYSANKASEPSAVEPQVLDLVSPDGAVYEVRNLGNGEQFRVADWAPGSSRALILRGLSKGRDGFGTVQVLDLETGATVGSFTLPAGVGTHAALFTRPTGQNIVVSASGGANGWLNRYSPTGKELATLLSETDPSLPPYGIINFSPSWLYSQDGTYAVVSHKGLWRISSDGSTKTAIPLPSGTLTCTPVRWWDAARVLARCDDDLGPDPDLPSIRRTSSNMWLLPVTGGAPTRLSSYVSKQVVDFGITDAWDVAGTRFAQWTGDCGAASFGTLTASGKYAVLTNGVVAVGHRGATFVAEQWASCGDPGSALVLVNGTNGAIRTFLPRVGDAEGVQQVIAR